MSSGQLIALVLAAVAVFWMVGAYNRMVSLRTSIGQAWAKVDEALRQRGAAAQSLMVALREPLAAEQGALDAWQAALTENTRSAAQMSAKPVVQAHALAWVATETAQAGAASRVFALLDQHTELRAQEAVAADAALWRDAQARLAFARQFFNEAAQPYNEAIALFPTRILVPMFSFGPAGRL